jgi:DNA-binding protein H-NS
MTEPNRQLLALAEAQRLVREHDISREELVAFEVPRGSSAWERQRRIALDQCRQLVDFWNISPGEIRDATLTPTAPLPPKYRHPIEGHTWDGAGSQPEWLKRALTKEGYTVSELRVGEAGALS